MTTFISPHPAPFPADGRRLIIYVVYDRRGEVDDFIPYALHGLREHAHRILVVVNGALSSSARDALHAVADEIIVRPNDGYDIWGYKAGLDHVGPAISDFDEVVLANDTWFGPVRPFGPVFERMNARSVHLWGMTDHPEEIPNPFTKTGVMPRHLQSFWVAARREIHQSDAWLRYWSKLPAIATYNDAILLHEIVFTKHFEDHGFVAEAAFPASDYPTPHPAIFNPDLLLADGCPLIKRRPLFHYPPFLTRNAVIGRDLVTAIAGYGYPVAMVWENLARNVPPKTLNSDEGMLEVLSDVVPMSAPPQLPRIAVVLHVGPDQDPDAILDGLDGIHDGFDLFIGVADSCHVSAIEQRVRSRSLMRRVGHLNVSHAASDDMADFFLVLREHISAGSYDLVVKLHTGAPREISSEAQAYFRRYQLDNLLSSAEFFRRALDLFRREPGLGVVFPAPQRIGDPPFRRAWPAYRPRVQAAADAQGIRVPLDDLQPLAPTGGMWIARPEALVILRDHPYEDEDYRERGPDGVSALGRTQQVLVPLAAGEMGYHCRTVLTPEHAAISHTSLEFVIDELSSATLGYPVDQIEFMQRAAWSGDARALSLARVYLRVSHPDLARRWLPAFQRARSLAHRARATGAHARRLLWTNAGRRAGGGEES